MPSRQPMLSPPGNTNVWDPSYFYVLATFGSSVLASYFGRELTFARNSAGNYTLTLPQTYRTVLTFDWGWKSATGALLFPVIKTDTMSTDGKLVFETRTEAGVATDPTSGDKLFLCVGVSRNVLNDDYVVTV